MGNFTTGKRFSNEWVTHGCRCLPPIASGNGKPCRKRAMLGSCSREAGTPANDSSFFTLITQSRVSADGSIYKWVSVGFISALELRENKAQWRSPQPFLDKTGGVPFWSVALVTWNWSTWFHTCLQRLLRLDLRIMVWWRYPRWRVRVVEWRHTTSQVKKKKHLLLYIKLLISNFGY